MLRVNKTKGDENVKHLYSACDRYGNYQILVEADNINEASLLLFNYQKERGLEYMFRIMEISKEKCDYDKYDDYIYG